MLVYCPSFTVQKGETIYKKIIDSRSNMYVKSNLKLNMLDFGQNDKKHIAVLILSDGTVAHDLNKTIIRKDQVLFSIKQPYHIFLVYLQQWLHNLLSSLSLFPVFCQHYAQIAVCFHDSRLFEPTCPCYAPLTKKSVFFLEQRTQ